MISTQGLASELSDAGKLFGILLDSGEVDGGWFGDPLGKLGNILGNPSQRAALIRLLDALLPPQPLAGIPDNEKWHPLLGSPPQGNLYLTVKNGGSSATFGMGGEFGGDAAKLRVQVPLVTANSGVHAVAGPLRVQLRVQLGFATPAQPIGLDAISITANISGADSTVAVKLEKLALGGRPPVDTILDPASLGAEAVQLILGLMQQALHDLAAAAGTEADAVAKHFLPLLGLGDPAIPAFPFGDLAGLQNWLKSLLNGPITAWLPHLAGLIGSSGVAVTGSGTEADPWSIALVELNPQSALALSVARAGNAMLVGFRVTAQGAVGRLDAQANIASIPVAGIAAATVLPSASFLFVKGPGLVATPTITAAILHGGLRWTGAVLQPTLELLDVTLAGTHYEKIDLTNTDSLPALGLQAALLAVLGNGTGRHLAALAALVPPAGDAGSTHLANPAALVSDPARAIGQAHRAVLLDGTHNWSFLLAEIGALLGLPSPVAGSGTQVDPWRIGFGPASTIGVEIAAWNAQSSGNAADPQKLRIGLRASADSAPLHFAWLAELLAIDLPQSGVGSASLMAGQHLSFLVQPGPTLPSTGGVTLRADSFEANMDWTPGSSVEWRAGVNNLSVTAEGATVTLAALRFPSPAGFDINNPAATAASLGISVANLELLLRMLLAKAALSWGQMPGSVLAALAGVHKALPGFQKDWPLLTGFLPDPFAALRTWLEHVTEDVSADGTPFLPVALDWLQALLSATLPNSPADDFTLAPLNGAGTYEDPWTLPFSDGQTVDALVWLEPAGPPANWAVGIGTRASAAADFNVLIAAAGELAAFVPALADAVRDVDAAALANALSQIANHLSTTDGVVPLESQIPTGGTWTAGTPIQAAHPLQPKDPSAIAQINAQIDSLAGGAAGARAVLLLGPAFSDHNTWSDLIAGRPSANFNFRLPGVEPAAVNLDTVTSAVDLYTADLASTGDAVAQIGRATARIAQLRPGVPVTLVAHSTAGVAARAFTSANAAQVKGLITLGTPHFGADLPFLNDPDFATGVRMLQGLRAGLTATPLRDALDHMVQAMDGYLPADAPGALPTPAPYPAFTGAASTDTGGKPALALGGTITGDLLGALKAAIATLAGQAAASARPAPTHIAFGLRAHLELSSSSSGDVNCDAALRVNLFRLKLRKGVAEPARPATGYGVRVYLSRPGGWLLLTPTARVRTAEFGVDIGTASTPFLHLRQAAYRSPLVSSVSISDPTAQLLLGEVMHALSLPAPLSTSPVSVLLSLLQSFNVATTDPNGGIGISSDAFAAITTDAAGFFRTRLAAALQSGTAGLNAPILIGGLPLELNVSPTGISIRTAPSLSLVGDASISFDTSNLSASFNIGALSFGFASGQLTMQAPPCFPAIKLPPDAATLTSVLNDALPNLLFSSASGALLEALTGPGLLVGPLHCFFSNTGSTASNSSTMGDGSGGFDGLKINDFLQILNHLAGFPSGPGFTLPAGFQLTATGTNPAVISLSTTAAIGGVLSFKLSASIDRQRHVTPGGTLTLNTPLTGTWPSVAVTFGVDPAGLSLVVTPGGVPPIQILPVFSGLGSLAGAAEALLPQALDALVTALAPAPAWLTNALSLAQALSLYDPAGHFSAHTADLKALLGGNFLGLFDPSKRNSVATAAVTFFNSLGGLPGTVSSSGATINWSFSLGGADSGTVAVALGWDGTGPVATLSAANLKLGSGALAVNLTAGYGSGTVQCSSDWSVPLLAALNLDLSPKLSVTISGSAFNVSIYPLAAHGANGPLTISLAPTVGVQISAGGPQQLIENLMLPLATDVVFQAIKPHLPDVLWTDSVGTKTVESLLLAAKIIDKGATPPLDTLHTPRPSVITMVSGLLTTLAGISIPVTSTLNLALQSEGTRFGIALNGHEDFITGNFTVSVRFGAPAAWDAGADAGIFLKLIDTAGGAISFRPGMTIAGLGLGLTGLNDAPLIDLAGFRLGGFTGYVFFESEFVSGPLFSDFGAGMDLHALGLPLGLATGGNVGGDNPVAASLLRSDGGSGGDSHPVNPAVDVQAWAWHQPFQITFGGQTGILWIGVHRGFGPIHIDQVGIEVGANSMALLIDGSVKVAGLTAQAHELSVAVPYKAIASPGQWSLDLKGLAVSFQSPGVTVVGGLLKSDGPPVEYDGLLIIQVTQFGFIAIGAYSTPTDPGTNDRYTSLFIFAGVFIVIGLPPIIQITGLGLGIGYNRELIPPNDLEQIPNFVLVEALDRPDKIADDPMGTLLRIRDQMPARRGSFWLAAGIRGTSFVVVQVTAVLYIALDRGIEIGLLGVARMALPSNDTALVSVELALKVRFSSAESLFSIQAQLTSNSYLLNKDCQLTGGFAYFMWFAKAQFLLTLGGYHPAFHKLPEYPEVPRLGYHWSFLGVVHLKGESYFALTNSCVMAGTRFEASYGPDWLQVWLTAYADFLLSWDPFFYDIQIGIAVGARFRMHLLFVDVNITVSLGASLHISGPPLHGEVTVDLAVASVTVAFGPDPRPDKQYIDWNTFVQKCLQADQPGNEAATTHVLTGLLPPVPAGGQPSPGTQAQPWKMATEWSFQTETRMPAMEFSFQTEFARAENEWLTRVFGHYSNLSTVYNFDIAPMGVDHAARKLLSKHIVQISRWDGKRWVVMVPADAPVLPEDDRLILDGRRFRMEPVLAQVSEATYHLMPHDDVPAGARTLPVIAGIKITGVAILQNESKPIPIATLFDSGHSRPLPFATLTIVIVNGLKFLGTAADTLALAAASSSTRATTSAAEAMLSGGGFFSQARLDAGLPTEGLHPLATRALRSFRSSPPLLAPITTGLTMQPVGQNPPPAIREIPKVDPVPLASARLRAVLQGRYTPTADVPPLFRTTVKQVAREGLARLAAPQLATVPGARLQFVRAANAPSPTRIAKGGRTLRSFQFGWSAGLAHTQAFTQAEDRISGNGISVPAGTTHIWDIPPDPKQTLAIFGQTQSVARVTCLSRVGNVLEDQELVEGNVEMPDGCAMLAVTCLGKSVDGIAGWQTGNRAQQVGSTALLCTRSVLVLPQVAATVKAKQASAQASVLLSAAMVDQPGVETWLPLSSEVIGILLDVEDQCAAADGDLAIAVDGAEIATPPVRVAGGRRKLLLYDVVKRTDGAVHISVAVASRTGARMAGVAGLSGTAQEWGVRFNGGVPEHLVPDGPSTPDGEVTVRIFSRSQ